MGHRPILALGFALGILLGDAATGSARSISSPQIPLAFEANAGQTDPEVKFLARGAGYGAFLTPTGVVLALPVADKGEPAALRIAFAGARRKATLTGLDELPGKANYFTGSDPARWRRDVPTFARVRARQVVIDPVLSYSSYLGGSDTDQGQSVAVDAAGFVYLTGDTASPNFPMKFPMQPTRQGFMDAFVTKLAPDGHVVYSTYLGGSSVQMGLGIAADRLGNAYVAGWTASANFPTLNAFQPAMKGPSDAFVVKLDRKGGLAYSTFLGGTSGPDTALGIGVDGRGSAVVTGYTASLHFPVQNPLQHLGGGFSGALLA